MSEWIIRYRDINSEPETVTSDYYRLSNADRFLEFKSGEHKVDFTVAVDLVHSVKRNDPQMPETQTVKVDSAVIRSEINKQIAKQGYTRR